MNHYEISSMPAGTKILFAKPTKVMKNILAKHEIDAGNANIFDILIHKSTIVLQSGTPGLNTNEAM